MTILWKDRSARALIAAKKFREKAAELPMRTHARKHAFRVAQYHEREADECARMAEDQSQ